LEILIYIIAALIGIIGLFLIIEYPYHFIGIYIFFSFYQFNVELPGPLDSRGLITLTLFFRLIAFDKENLSFILNRLFTNHFFILILVFEIIFIAVTYATTDNYKSPIRLFIFQLIGIMLGFLAVYRGYTMKTFGTAIFVTGFVATLDLIYSFGVTSQLFVRRVLDVLIKTEYSTDLNHNSFGMMNGIALVSTYVMFVSKKIQAKTGIILLFIFGTGIFLSTSRTTLLTALVTLFFATLIFPRDQIDVKKIFMIGVKGVVFLFVVIAGFLLTLNVLKVDSQFTDKIYYRLVEEPMNLMEGKTSKFRGESEYLKEGSASWRISKAIMDYDKFTALPFSSQFLGFGFEGYSFVGEKDFDKYDQIRQKASHNGLITLIVERGILGFILFFVINFLLFRYSANVFKENIFSYPFYALIIFTFIYTLGAAPIIITRFGYILIGGILGQIIYHEQHFDKDNNEQDNLR